MGGPRNRKKETSNNKGTSNAKVSRGGKEKKRKYENNDVKCSVDVGARNRGKSDDGIVRSTGPAIGAKFQKGGGNNKSIIKSATDAPKDARTRACAKWMEEVLSMGLKGIRKEFISTIKPYVPSGSSDAFSEHEELNRYEDVKCLDSSRVKLKSSPDSIDYIHASFVQVQPDLVYVCAQGPLSNTIEHFWLMIIQEKSKVVLQLCSFLEDGNEKCEEYYPQAADGTEWKSYGGVQIRVLERTTNVAGMKKVTKSKLQVKLEDKENIHDVIHIFYFGWPDHAVAESVATCREVRNLVHRTYEKKPIIAHCSAGIGRTGTFVMIELVCHQLLTKHDADFRMFDLAKELRDQRFGAIQNDQQYVFIYRCVVEILLAEDAFAKSPEVTKFIESYDAFIKRKKEERAKLKNKTT